MIAPRASAEMPVSESPERRAEQIAGPTAVTRATRRGRTEKTRKADPTRVTEKQDAGTRSLELSLKSLGEELGNTLAERTAAELRAERLTDALVRLQVELAQSGAERAADAAERERMRGEAAELRELMDRQASEWRIERAALAGERDAVARRLKLRGARSGAGRAGASEGHATRLEKHAAWAGEQIAVLVESEAATAAELRRKQAEWEVLNIRLDGLRAELRSKEADLVRYCVSARARAASSVLKRSRPQARSKYLTCCIDVSANSSASLIGRRRHENACLRSWLRRSGPDTV